ncbi:VirK family protein [Sinorhizobium fredii]|nr:VirK family protein [Sinorhizobium fredii]
MTVDLGMCTPATADTPSTKTRGG